MPAAISPRSCVNLERVEDLLRVAHSLLNRLDAVEQIVELAGELSGRLHRHDLISDELERILDEIQLAARDAQVVADLTQLVEPLLDDGQVLLCDVTLRVLEPLRCRPLP